MIAVTLIIHSAMTLLSLVCSIDIRTKGFLQTKIIAVLKGSKKGNIRHK